MSKKSDSQPNAKLTKTFRAVPPGKIYPADLPAGFVLEGHLAAAALDAGKAEETKAKASDFAELEEKKAANPANTADKSGE